MNQTNTNLPVSRKIKCQFQYGNTQDEIKFFLMLEGTAHCGFIQRESNRSLIEINNLISCYASQTAAEKQNFLTPHLS